MCYYKEPYFVAGPDLLIPVILPDYPLGGEWRLDLMVHEERPESEDTLIDNPRPSRCCLRWIFTQYEDCFKFLPHVRITGRRYHKVQTLGYSTDILVRNGIGSWAACRYEQYGKGREDRPDVTYRPFLSDADKQAYWDERNAAIEAARIAAKENPQT
jgi:hypothetical protein